MTVLEERLVLSCSTYEDIEAERVSYPLRVSRLVRGQGQVRSLAVWPTQLSCLLQHQTHWFSQVSLWWVRSTIHAANMLFFFWLWWLAFLSWNEKPFYCHQYRKICWAFFSLSPIPNVGSIVTTWCGKYSQHFSWQILMESWCLLWLFRFVSCTKHKLLKSFTYNHSVAYSLGQSFNCTGSSELSQYSYRDRIPWAGVNFFTGSKGW